MRARAGAAVSLNSGARRAGSLASAEAASDPGREDVTALVLFASGAHAGRTEEVALGARDRFPDAWIAVVGGASALSPGGDVEGSAAVSAIALTTPVVGAACTDGDATPAAMGKELGAALSGSRARPFLLFARGPQLTPTLIDAFTAEVGVQGICGGGVHSTTSPCLGAPGEPPRAARAIALRLDGGVRLSCGASAGVTLLGDVLRIDAVEAGYITLLGGRKPLEHLQHFVSGRKDRPLVLVAFEPGAEGSHRPGFRVVRGVAGVDPARGAIHIGPDAAVGMELSFVAHDRAAARTDYQCMLRDLARGLAGGVPIAGFLHDCATRGRRLYGAPHVDVRATRTAFEGLPFAGVHLESMLVPTPEGFRPAAHTGTFAVLYAPS